MAAVMRLKDQAATRFGKSVALGKQAFLQILPVARIGEVVSEERPQGSDEPLIRPDGRLRFGAAPDIAIDGFADDLANADVVFPCNPFKDGPDGRIKAQGRFHAASFAADG
ncbi:MAG: hypothetical protein NTW20_04850 [Rhodobacterales bacterium]|nr:hypothetical protein [Rhodobacterales bacterium]